MTNEHAQTKVIEIPFWKALSVVSGAVLVSIVGTTFTVGTVLNTDHFVLARTVDEVAELKQKKADSALIEYRLNEIDKKLSNLDSKIDSLALRTSNTSKSAVASVRTVSQPVQTIEPQQQQAQSVSVEQIQPQPEPAPSPRTPGKSENSQVISTPILKIETPLVSKLLGGE